MKALNSLLLVILFTSACYKTDDVPAPQKLPKFTDSNLEQGIYQAIISNPNAPSIPHKNAIMVATKKAIDDHKKNQAARDAAIGQAVTNNGNTAGLALKIKTAVDKAHPIVKDPPPPKLRTLAESNLEAAIYNIIMADQDAPSIPHKNAIMVAIKKAIDDHKKNQTARDAAIDQAVTNNGNTAGLALKIKTAVDKAHPIVKDPPPPEMVDESKVSNNFVRYSFNVTKGGKKEYALCTGTYLGKNKTHSYVVTAGHCYLEEFNETDIDITNLSFGLAPDKALIDLNGVEFTHYPFRDKENNTRDISLIEIPNERMTEAGIFLNPIPIAKNPEQLSHNSNNLRSYGRVTGLELNTKNYKLDLTRDYASLSDYRGYHQFEIEPGKQVEWYNKRFTNVCVGKLRQQGDSGGPLYHVAGNKVSLSGVISESMLSLKCAKNITVIVYIAPYIKWLSSFMSLYLYDISTGKTEVKNRLIDGEYKSRLQYAEFLINLRIKIRNSIPAKANFFTLIKNKLSSQLMAELFLATNANVEGGVIPHEYEKDLNAKFDNLIAISPGISKSIVTIKKAINVAPNGNLKIMHVAIGDDGAIELVEPKDFDKTDKKFHWELRKITDKTVKVSSVKSPAYYLSYTKTTNQYFKITKANENKYFDVATKNTDDTTFFLRELNAGKIQETLLVDSPKFGKGIGKSVADILEVIQD